jgi:hypothetical protein
VLDGAAMSPPLRLSLLALFVLACSAPADGDVAVSSGEALSKNDLTLRQQKKVLTLLDDACGDAWCETDWSFTFTKVACDWSKASCALSVRVKSRTLSCTMSHVGHRYSAIVDTAKNGYQSLSDGFFARVDACMTKIEGKL